MQLVVASLGCLLLAHVARAGLFGWGWDFGNYRDARSNYNELMTHCEREGGSCIDVDFNTGYVGGGGPPVAGGGGGGGGGAEAEEQEGSAKPASPKNPPAPPRNGKRRPKLARRRPMAVRRPAAAPRKRRQANPFYALDYLSRECWNWEFDLSCHGKGNICCY